MTALLKTKPIKYVISSPKNAFYTLEEAKEKIMEYKGQVKLDTEAMIYEVKKAYKIFIVSEVKVLEDK